MYTINAADSYEKHKAGLEADRDRQFLLDHSLFTKDMFKYKDKFRADDCKVSGEDKTDEQLFRENQAQQSRPYDDWAFEWVEAYKHLGGLTWDEEMTNTYILDRAFESLTRKKYDRVKAILPEEV